MNFSREITVIGAAIIDIMVSGDLSDKNILETKNVDKITFSFGGDALNESVVLSKLGADVDLITVVGADQTGEQIIDYLEKNDISISKVYIESGLRTSINIVLVDKDGERYFLSDSNSSLRKLNKEHILKQIEGAGHYVSFASLFVSPILKVEDLAEIFREIKKSGRFLVADMTRAKSGEKAEDLKPFLKYIDILVGNADEFKVLTGTSIPEDIIDKFLQLGSQCIIVKDGEFGSVLGANNQIFNIPAYETNKVVDTTGAGDSYVAGLLWGIINGFPMINACLFASALSSCMVEELGATNGFDSVKEVERRFEELKTKYFGEESKSNPVD